MNHFTTAFVLVLAGCATTAAPQTADGAPRGGARGVHWDERPFETVLADASRTGKRVVVDFWADWCGPCRRLGRDVLETTEGAGLVRGHLATRLDFDSPGARPIVERYGIIGLPTVLVLDSSGREIERIQGYETKAAWVEEARAALSATDPVPTLEARAREAPQDPAAQFELGWRVLVRGDLPRGEALLGRTVLLDPANARGYGAKALYTLGRYHQRVRLDFRVGRNLWRELATRFPQSEEALSALTWWANAEAEMGQRELGAEVVRLAATADGATTGHLLVWAEYARDHDVDRAAALAAVEAALPSAPADEAAALRSIAGELRRPTTAASQ